jgi:hypothetical protein
LIYARPEILLSASSYFILYSRNQQPLPNNPIAVALECPVTIADWGDGDQVIKDFHIFELLSFVSFVGLSAALTPDLDSESRRPTLIKKSIRRTPIINSVRRIEGKGFCNLTLLLPTDLKYANDIPITLISLDCMKTAIKMACWIRRPLQPEEVDKAIAIRSYVSATGEMSKKCLFTID